MTYNEAREALNDLYYLFDRGILMQKSAPVVETKDSSAEPVESLKIDNFLGNGCKVEESSTPKLKKVFALIEAIGYFSEELFGKKVDEWSLVYMTLKKGYMKKMPISDEFLKREDFLGAFGKQLKTYE